MEAKGKACKDQASDVVVEKERALVLDPAAAKVQESLTPRAPPASGQPQTGIFERIKSIATQNSFVTRAVTQLTHTERERAEVAEAERDRAIRQRDNAIEAAARLRYERDETRAIACFFLAATIFTGSLSLWMAWICTIVAAFGATRVVNEHLDSMMTGAHSLTQRLVRASASSGMDKKKGAKAGETGLQAVGSEAAREAAEAAAAPAEVASDARPQKQEEGAEKSAPAAAADVAAAGKCGENQEKTSTPSSAGKPTMLKRSPLLFTQRKEEGVGDFLRNFVPAAIIASIFILIMDFLVLPAYSAPGEAGSVGKQSPSIAPVRKDSIEPVTAKKAAAKASAKAAAKASAKDSAKASTKDSAKA
jgi:hypothetical protein